MSQGWNRSVAVLMGFSFSIILGPIPVGFSQEDDELQRDPGLIASYHESNHHVFSRVDASPAMNLSSGQTPDPRLTDGAWEVRYQGVLEIKSPGEYRFGARTNGSIVFKVSGKTVLDSMASEQEFSFGDPIPLKFGLNPIEIRFKPTGKGAKLKLAWSSSSFPEETIPSYVLGHRSNDPHRDAFHEGRLALEEHNCRACHQVTTSAKTIANWDHRVAPRLVDAGSRLQESWIFHWLGDPSKFRPETTMPKLFSENRSGEIQRLALARFLASRGNYHEASIENRGALAEAGAKLFIQTGCAACHEKTESRPAVATLIGLGKKTNPTFLAEFIRNPEKIVPSGRMPGFEISQQQALQLATYLTDSHSVIQEELSLPGSPSVEELNQEFQFAKFSNEEIERLGTKPVGDQLITLGSRLVRSKQCANCHQIEDPQEKTPAPIMAKATFEQLNKPGQGCLKPDSELGTSPRFTDHWNRDSVVQTISALTELKSESPGLEGNLMVSRLNCLRCHERHASGGLGTELLAKLIVNQTEDSAESLSPPTLTGVADKLLGSYLNQVLTEGRRSRPWMSLKMPKYPKELVKDLPGHFAAADGDTIEMASYRPDPEEALVQAGHTLIGEKGFGCIKCHDMLGIRSQGTRGPELTQMADRVKYGWFEKWMNDPQRIQPGTRMPTFFPEGKSPYTEIMHGDLKQQKLALWHYLLNAKQMPYPEGLVPKSLDVLTVTTKPLVVRTFLPDATPRSLAIRFPNNVHLAFDAQACRVCYGWEGEFLDMSPVWGGRGGQRATLKGTRFWNAPEGFPWEVTRSEGSVPDFEKHINDTTLGAELPHDGKLHPTRLHFKGYKSDPLGPTFRYELESEEETTRFEEQTIALRYDTHFGVRRKIRVNPPAQQTVWFLVAASENPIEIAQQGDQFLPLAEAVPVESTQFIKLTEQGKPILVRLRNKIKNGDWLSSKQGSRQLLVLRMKPGEAAPEIDTITWRPSDPDQLPDLLRHERAQD